MNTEFSVPCLLAKSAQKAIDDRKCWLVVLGPAVGHRAIPDNRERECASRGSLLNKTVRSLRGHDMVLTLSFDTRPSSMPLKCTYEVEERRAVSVH